MTTVKTERCLMEWHYGTIGPLFHVDDDGRQGWRGFHGAQTPNVNRICDECIADTRENYPGSIISTTPPNMDDYPELRTELPEEGDDK